MAQRILQDKAGRGTDFHGASINTFASKESASLSARMAAKDKDKILNLKEIILEPSFDATEFDKEKKRLLVSLEQQKESPEQLFASYLINLFMAIMFMEILSR
jgi:predicted Zn-dependent peptidase